MKKVMSLIIVVSILSIFIFSPVVNAVLTASIGNARMVLYPEIVPGEETVLEKTILVKNVNEIPVNVKLEEKDGLVGIVEIVDKEFTLAPGTEKKAKFLIKVSEKGRYEGRINVFFSEIKTEPGTTTGVALSSTVIVVAREEGSDEEIGEIDEIPEKNINPITGKAISGENSFGVLGIMTGILIVLLLGLLYYMQKKKVVRKEGVNEIRKKK